MPVYVPTEWTNETPAETPIRYTLRDSEGEILYDGVTIEVLTSITPGTALNSTQMNHIEQGIKDAQDTANLDVVTSKLVDGILSADAEGRAKMADSFITLAKLSADLRFQKLGEFIGDGVNQPDWTGIPGTFRHLILIFSGLSSRETPSGWDSFGLRVNGDDGSNYFTSSYLIDPVISPRWNWGVTNPHNEGLFSGILPAQGNAYLEAGSGITIFPDYAGTTFYKSCMSLSFFYTTGARGFLFSSSRNTSADPITRLTGYMGERRPRTGSVFSIYGFN